MSAVTSHAPMVQSARRFDYYAIIPHASEPRALVVRGEGGWTLPHMTPREHHFGVVNHINQALAEQLGMKLSVLRCVSHTVGDGAETARAVYLMENHSPDWTPSEGQRWVGGGEIGGLPFVSEEQRACLEGWLAEAGETSARRRPWARPGWLSGAHEWIHTELERLGLRATGPVEQLRAWGISCILRVGTDGRNVYFRAVPETSAHEPLLLRELARTYPAHFPAILSVNVEERWILMEEMGGEPLYLVFDVACWERALRDFAQIQIDCAVRTESLLKWGCPDRRLERLAAEIDPLLEDTDAMQVGRPKGLTASEVAALRALAPRLRAMCSRLAGYAVPQTLEHGDFHPYNVHVREGAPVYFDWSESSVAHPFFSLAGFEYYMEFLLPDMRRERRRVREAYLEPWTVYEPMGRLAKALELSRPLAALHSAVTFRRLLLSLEEKARWEMEVEAALPFSLKMLLKYARHGG